MSRVRSLITLPAALVYGLCFAPAANADALLTLDAFTIAGTNTSLDVFAIDPFDPALGALDEIQVQITGTLTATGHTVPVLDAFGAPIPYAYQIDVASAFGSLGTNLFDFSDDGHFFFGGTAAGTGASVVHVQPFSYSFTFTDTTDLVGGFALINASGVIPPPMALADRTDFLPTILGLYDMRALFTASYQAGFQAPIDLSGGGSVQVTYKYTPTVQAVPEPSASILLGLALAVSAARRRPVPERPGRAR